MARSGPDRPLHAALRDYSAGGRPVAIRSCYSTRPCLRFSCSLLSLAVSMILALICLPAHGQIGTPDGQIFNGETATPMPGGHDYIHLAAETVNPSNGSVTIKINYPMPKGRGITLPFAATYNSAGLYRVGVNSTSPGVVTLVENDRTSYTGYPWASWTTSSFNIPPHSCGSQCGAPTSEPCHLASGFSFTDQYGTSHNLSLGAVTQVEGYSTTSYCPPAGPPPLKK